MLNHDTLERKTNVKCFKTAYSTYVINYQPSIFQSVTYG